MVVRILRMSMRRPLNLLLYCFLIVYNEIMKVILTIPKELDEYVDQATIQKRIDDLIITPLLNELKKAKVETLLQTERPKIKNELQKVREKVSINITGGKVVENVNFPEGYTPPQEAKNDVVINSKDI